MKKYKSLASMVTAALLSVSIVGGASAADWTTYQGNNQHNGVTTTAPITVAESGKTIIGLQNNKASMSGVNTVPVMQTLTSGETYGYVLHNGGTVSGNNGGARLSKIKANDASKVWSKQLTLAAGFQLSSPLLVQGNDPTSEADDTVYVGTTGYAQVLENDELNGTDVEGWDVNGGTADGKAIVLEGEEDVTLTQDDFELNTTATNRAALGIWVGNSPNPGVEIKVTVKVNGVEKVVKSFPATTTAIEDTENKGNYYYYVNENFAATAGNVVEFDVDVISGNKNQVKVEYASLYQQTGSIQKVTNLHETAPSNTAILTGLSGQINTPITTDGKYLYFGTWKGGKSAGTYYQVNMSNNSVKTFTPDAYGFYWAGAAVYNGNVYFGSDNGTLHYRSVDDFEGSGGTIALEKNGVVPGNIRSTIMVHNDKLYFTSQGKYLWEVSFGKRGTVNVNSVSLPGTSTSTPTITENNRLYIGYYNGFNVGGVEVFDVANGLQRKDTKAIGPVQSSIVAKSVGTTDYIYFTTNSSAGAGYSYAFDGTTFAENWDTTSLSGNTYTLQGMAESNGHLMFGNDFNNLTIVK